MELEKEYFFYSLQLKFSRCFIIIILGGVVCGCVCGVCVWGVCVCVCVCFKFRSLFACLFSYF